MNIGEIIYSRRKKLGLTLEDVGNAVGVSKSTVKKWETGYIANIKRDKILGLFEVLQISPVTLINGDHEPSNISYLPQDKVRMVPLFESVSAGFGAYASSEIIEYIPIYIKCDDEADNTLCITVSGNSMYPKIEDGDIVQVQKAESVDSGRIAVVLVDGDDGRVKRVVYGKDWIELQSINPEYQTQRFEGADVQRIRIVGLVKKIIKNC